MATYYLDFEGGNDANNGTTFANRWKTLTSGATAARIAPGDEIRIMGSPEPTSLGQNGVWTSSALQAVKTMTGATNATPISVTLASHGWSTGDTVVITGATGNTAANGTWEITVTGTNTFTLDGSSGNGTFVGTSSVRLRNNTRVMLTTAVTQNIASTGPGRAAWTATAGGNITTSLSNTTKEHVNSDSIAIAAGFTTGLAAYWTLPSTLDLSGYQQVSFWIQQTAGTVGAAGAVDLRLCSDTAGATAVNTINIPNLVVTGRWMPVTVDLGTNLGNSIRSIALYVNTDNGAQTFLLSNIIACKASSAADSLTLTSLIGKNTTGETFWGIQSINGKRVMLDADTNATPTSTSLRGYYGTSETVTTWKRETIKLGPAASSTTIIQSTQDGGSAGSQITFSGGWNRTDMSTQSLETWLDGLNGLGIAVECNQSFLTLTSLAFVRFTSGFRFNNVDTNYGNVFSFVAGNNNSANAIRFIGKGSSVTVGAAVANGSYGFSNSVQSTTNTYTISNASSNAFGGLDLAGVFVGDRITCTAYNNSGSGIDFSASAVMDIGSSAFMTCVTQDNASGGVNINTRPCVIRAKNCLINESTEIVAGGTYGTSFASHDHDQVTGNHKIFMDGALISAATDQRKTASGISWKIQPTTTTNRGSYRPVVLPLAKVACAANSLVTIKAWMRRDNSGLTMRLVCKGGQIAGVANDVIASVTTTNAWEEETITFTPTEVGVVEITAEAWGGTTFSGWVDDMTISQA